MNDFHSWVGGEAYCPATRSVYESLNPELDTPFATITRSSVEDVCHAVEVARTAFESYRNTTISQREAWLLRAAELIDQRQAELIDVLIQEVGSPISKARKELSTAISLLRASAGSIRNLTGKTHPTEVAGRWSLSVRRPIGVVAGITPFNVPLIKAIKHSAMPLATGNTVVLLPSEHATVTALQVGKIFHEAGFPAGTFNIVTGFGAEIGDALTQHPLVSCVTFTGSPRVGRHVAELCGTHNKRYQLELGGKNPLVVLANAELPNAIRAATFGGFLYQGQICMASSRVIVERAVLDQFLEGFLPAVQSLSMGPLDDPNTMIGPIIHQRQREKISRHLADATRQGAHVLCGGEWVENRLQPTVLTNVSPRCAMHAEETFGPVVAVYAADTADDAMRMANDTAFGLSAAIFTRDIGKAMEFAEASGAGMVHINGATLQEEAHIPFGGNGESGFGRESTDADIQCFTDWKWITLQHPG